MFKTFQIVGYGTNKRGHTVGIHYMLAATSADAAKEIALRTAVQGGYKHIRFTTVEEVSHD